MTSRLFQAFPELAAQFSQATAGVRRQVVAEACAFAVKESGLEAAEIEEAVAWLQGEGVIDGSLKLKIDELTEALDEAYFSLVEEADGLNAEGLAFFSKARASAALGFALLADGEALEESLYEAISAADAEAPTVERLAAMLRKGDAV